MPSDQLPPIRNHLLSRLSEEDKALLLPKMRIVPLKLGQEIETPAQKLEHVYFLESGIASMMASLPRSRDLEVGLFGRDGMSGSALVQYDDRSAYRTVVQMKGSAFRIDASDLLDAVRARESIRILLTRFARALSIQVGSTAIANGHSKLEDRLARWVLLAHDRVDGDRMFFTHEHLARMLGVRRSGVTVALHILEGKGLIRSRRSEIIVLDRGSLMELADGAYGLAEEESVRLTGWSLR
jgi:CRP-like cAMP-binding protein